MLPGARTRGEADNWYKRHLNNLAAQTLALELWLCPDASSMPFHDLTPSEVADLIAPRNHPGRLSAEELDGLTNDLSEAHLDELIHRLGVPTLVRQLPPLFHRILLSAQRVTRDASTDYEDAIGDLLDDFDTLEIAGMFDLKLFITVLTSSRNLHPPALLPGNPQHAVETSSGPIHPSDPPVSPSPGSSRI